MVNRKILILNSMIFMVILIVSYSLNAYVAEEYLDSEYLIDEYTSSFDRDEFHNFLEGDNRVIISGGCYNVEQLSMKSMLKLSLPVNSIVDFKLNHIGYDNFEFNERIFNFGLSFRISDFASLGFLTNPTFYKKESDISIIASISGSNTDNVIIFTFDNFDNNYSHKNYNENLPEPRIYLKQPYSLYIKSTGNLQDLRFYTIFLRRFSSSEKHYYLDHSLDSFLYDYTADSALMFITTGYRIGENFKDIDFEIGCAITGFMMENGYMDSLQNIYENDERMNISGYITGMKNNFTGEIYGQIGERRVDSIYEKSDWLFSVGAKYRWGFLKMSFKQVISDIRSTIFEDSLIKESPQSRLILALTYCINEKTHFTALKGFETDIRDIKNGGKYFLYDKAYIQFYMNFDNFLKRK